MTKYENNYEFAIKFESKIFNEMLQDIDDVNQRKFLEYLFENDICLTPKEDESHMITINISSPYAEEYDGISRKLSNVQLDLRNSIISAFEFAIGIGIPETKEELLKLALLATIKLYVFSTVKLTDKECLLLLYLHEKNAYYKPVLEEEIFEAISRGKLRMNKDEYSVAIRNLVRLASIIIIDGKVLLKEKIELHYN